MKDFIKMIDEKRATTHKNTEEDCSGLSLALTLFVIHTSACSTHTHTKTVQMDCLAVNSSSPTRLAEMHLPLPADHFQSQNGILMQVFDLNLA